MRFNMCRDLAIGSLVQLGNHSRIPCHAMPGCPPMHHDHRRLQVGEVLLVLDPDFTKHDNHVIVATQDGEVMATVINDSWDRLVS